MANVVNTTNIVPPRVPMVDPKTGIITREWYRFLFNLFQITGSGTSPTTTVDLQLGPDAVSLASNNQSDIYDLSDAVNSSAPVETGELEQRINNLETSLGCAPRDELGTISSQNSSNVHITGGSISGVSISATGQALTKTDDTNVTLTLGGSPATALVSASSLALGWTGTLATTRGGTALSSFTSGGVMYASSTSALVTGSSLQFDGTSLGIGMTPATNSLYNSRYQSGGAINASYQSTGYGATPVFVSRQAGGTIASPSASTTATLSFIGSTTSDGTTFLNTVQIAGNIDSAPTATSHPTNITFSTTPSGSTTRSTRLTITSDGNVHPASGTTAMTSGFFYIPSAAGAPTGVPTAIAGRVPMYYDSTNNNFYVYNGTWKKVLLT